MPQNTPSAPVAVATQATRETLATGQAASRARTEAGAAPSLTEGLAVVLARPVAAALRRRAAAHVLDWIGCAAAGRSEPVGLVFARHGDRAPPGPCRILGAGRTDASTAAFVNGAFGNVLEMDDIHRTAILHPGPIVIPAALAAAEAAGASPGALLDAVVRGYEAVIRVGRSVGPGHYRHWHKTSTCGPFGAAAAVASILGLDQAAIASALGLAGTQSSGPWQCRLDGAGAKQLHTAAAARAGLDAARLAALGLDGPRAILEGELGLYAATCPDPEPDAVLADAESARWLIEDTSFKPWPACRHAHPAIDAALEAGAVPAGGQGPGRGARVDPARVESILVESYADALRYCDEPAPRTALAARFSLQHAVATALVAGPPTLDAFTPGSIAEPTVSALRARVRVAVAGDLDGAYPRHYGARVRIVLEDGAERVAEVRDALGDPENPLDDDALDAKARMLMHAGGLDTQASEALVAAVRGLADGAPVDDSRATSLATLTDRLAPT